MKNVEVVILEIGSSEFTDRNGLFNYPLRDRDRAQTPVQFKVEMPEYVIQDPVNGHTKIPKDRDLVTPSRIFMMKKGSPKLLTDVRIEKTIEVGTTKGKDQVDPKKKDIKEGDTSVDLTNFLMIRRRNWDYLLKNSVKAFSNGLHGLSRRRRALKNLRSQRLLEINLDKQVTDIFERQS